MFILSLWMVLGSKMQYFNFKSHSIHELFVTMVHCVFGGGEMRE